MTILSVFDQASKLMGKGARTTFVANTDPFAVEMLAIANELATEIAKKHDWNILITLNTETGDGSTTAFTLPDDYDRMPVKAKVFQGSTGLPMRHVTDLDEWLETRLQSFSGAVGEWIMLGGLIVIYVAGAAMSASETAKFYYISDLVVDPASGSNKTSFTIDTDTYRLPERLLHLGMIWKWKHSKGLDYAEDMQNYEVALAQEIARDKGSRMFAIGTPRIPNGVSSAFHGTISA